MDAKFFRKNAEEDDFDIHIDYDGTWFHQGRPIARDALAKLFSTVLHYDPDTQEYWLITPHEQGRIEVEDAPFVITDFEWDDGDLKLITNLHHEIKPDGTYPIIIKNDKPYCIMDHHVPARLNRMVREKLIDIALRQDGYDNDTQTLILKANGHDHIIAGA